MPEATIDKAGACRTTYRRELATFGTGLFWTVLLRKLYDWDCLVKIRK
jgi:hypothetical protein